MSSNIQAPPIPVILLGWSLVIGCGDPTGLSEDTDAILISTRRTTFLVDEFVNFTDVHVIRLDRLDELVNITDDGLSLGAEWSPDGSRIAFRSRRDYGRVDLSLLDPSGQVFVMDSDGRNARNLRNDTHEGRDRSIAWSPEGSEVAFEREGELCVADIRGRGVRCLTDGFAPRRSIREPTWSPTGDQIAFVSAVSSGDDIYTIEPDGSHLVNVSDAPGNDRNPAWSPDGLYLAFTSHRASTTGIHVTNADGTDVRRLTNSPRGDTAPIWSPGGDRIAFVRRRDGSQQVYVVNTDGTGLRNLSQRSGSDPTWSPDGTRIAFTNGATVFTVNVDGTGLNAITSDDVTAFNPRWCPRPST